jgi:hypothetical protein
LHPSVWGRISFPNAAIGAAAGAGAGAGTQILTRGKTVKVPAETTLRFKLDQPLTLQAAY